MLSKKSWYEKNQFSLEVIFRNIMKHYKWLQLCIYHSRDSLDTYLDAFSCNIGIASVFHAETLAFILVIEHAAYNGWRNLWLESDLSSALMICSNSSLVLWLLRNRWHNARGLSVQVISSHIFREGNSCAEKLANMDHEIQGSIWLDTLPAELHMDFYQDRIGLPNYRFPLSFISFVLFFFFFEGFGLVPPLSLYIHFLFFFFFIEFRVWQA